MQEWAPGHLSLGGDDVAMTSLCLPNLRHRQQIGLQRVPIHQGPVGMQMFSAGKESLPEVSERPLHWVDWVRTAGEDREFDKFVEGLRQFVDVRCQRQLCPARQQLRHRHPVHGDGAGLVSAEDRRRSKRLDRRGPSSQHVTLGDEPGTEHQEDGEDERAAAKSRTRCRV